MTDGISVDMGDFSKLIADLGAAPERAGRNIRKAIEVTARHVKDDWREPLKGSATVPAGPYSISYDVIGVASSAGSGVRAEIGPELKGQGAIVGLLEEGSPTTGPRGFGLAALQRNQEDLLRGLGIAIGDALG